MILTLVSALACLGIAVALTVATVLVARVVTPDREGDLARIRAARTAAATASEQDQHP
ncbi:hypothetical protein [Halostreptopolyspora alba]|uniref:hypothetical protein n=1 Tax=Halostreptopolyspora alba TaxID=2487137 RepID=UPI0026925E69